MKTKDDLHRIRTSPSQRSETADLGPACWFIVSRRALAPVAACGEATKPGLAPASAHRLIKSAASKRLGGSAIEFAGDGWSR
jgi:hypothetical protein